MSRTSISARSGDAVGTTSRCELHLDVAAEIRMDADRAIPVALIANELVTNAAKHAFPDRRNGQIRVRVARPDANTLSISVCDNGIGLPPEFDFTKSRRLGMRVVTTLARQLGGSITQQVGVDGTEFTLLVPLEHCGES